MPMEWVSLQLFLAHLFNYFANTLSSRKVGKIQYSSEKMTKNLWNWKMKEKNEERPTARGDKTCSTGQVRRVGWSSVPPQTPRYCSSWRCTLLTFRMGNFCPSYPPTQQQRQTLVLALLQQSPIAGIHPRPRSCEETHSGYEIGGIPSFWCQNARFTEISSKMQSKSMFSIRVLWGLT